MGYSRRTRSFEMPIYRPYFLNRSLSLSVLGSKCVLHLGIPSSVPNRTPGMNWPWQIQARKSTTSGTWTFPTYSGRFGNHLI